MMHKNQALKLDVRFSYCPEGRTLSRKSNHRKHGLSSAAVEAGLPPGHAPESSDQAGAKIPASARRQGFLQVIWLPGTFRRRCLEDF